jgi:crossover junction endodeoxyribonuclease RuvC
MPVSPRTNRVRVLGIDPGTRIVGYGVVDVRGPRRIEYVECGTLKLDGRRTLNARLAEIARGLQEIVEELAPSVLAIESAYAGRNPSSALKLAEARGVLKWIGLDAGLPIAEYAPARVKKVVVGKGRATKAEVQARVTLLCKLARHPAADAADALAVALCHAHSTRLPG